MGHSASLLKIMRCKDFLDIQYKVLYGQYELSSLSLSLPFLVLFGLIIIIILFGIFFSKGSEYLKMSNNCTLKNISIKRNETNQKLDDFCLNKSITRRSPFELELVIFCTIVLHLNVNTYIKCITCYFTWPGCGNN